MQKKPKAFCTKKICRNVFLGILGYCFGGIFLHWKVNDDELTVHQVF